MMVLLSFIAVWAPFEVSFIRTGHEVGPLFIMNRLIDICFLVDMVRNFFLPYYKENVRRRAHRVGGARAHTPTAALRAGPRRVRLSHRCTPPSVSAGAGFIYDQLIDRVLETFAGLQNVRGGWDCRGGGSTATR